MIYERNQEIPKFQVEEYDKKKSDNCLLIPVINEGERIWKELRRAQKCGIDQSIDIIICDGNSTDGSMEPTKLKELGVNTLLTKKDIGKQSTQLRMGIWWALKRGYTGIITIDGNNKDSIEDIPQFVNKLKEGYDFVQGSRFVKGGRGVRTPLLRYLSVRLIHAPVISLTAHFWFTDTTNAFRAYSKRYLEDERVQPLRDCFVTYELLAYLSVRASQLGMKVCEVPVKRVYPKNGKVPTKISSVRGNAELFKILILNLFGKFKPNS